MSWSEIVTQPEHDEKIRAEQKVCIYEWKFEERFGDWIFLAVAKDIEQARARAIEAVKKQCSERRQQKFIDFVKETEPVSIAVPAGLVYIEGDV
jgi:hypothetical protein